MLFLAIVTNNIYGQYDLPGFGPGKLEYYAIPGGKEGKLYAARIESSLPKKELIKTTISFLEKAGDIDKNDIKINEIDDSYSEFTIPMGIGQPTSFSRLSGMGITLNPVLIFFDVRFEFDNNGSVLIVFQNFSNKYFALLAKDYNEKYAENEHYKKFSDEQVTLLASNSLFNQAYQFVTNLKSLDEIQEETLKVIGDINKRFELYDAMVDDDKIADWFTPEEFYERMSKLLDKNTMSGKFYINCLERVAKEQRLLEVGERRWEKDIRPYFELLIKNINIEVKGKITNILEDGKDTWEIVDGLLVPTDKKLQKKYLKNKMSF